MYRGPEPVYVPVCRNKNGNRSKYEYEYECNANPGTETNPHSGAGHSTVLDWLIDFGVGWGYAFSFYTASLGVSLGH